jgi:RimJ/RimL family protein N-acetyltransferase
MNILIRRITEADAAALLHLQQTLDTETRFMLLEPNERTTTVVEVQAQIRHILASPNSMTFVAADEAQLIGYLGLYGGKYRRERSTSYLVIGIVQAYTGQGIGTRLFEAAETWARGAGVHRLELTVMAHNHAGIALYRKMGFTIEGTRREALLVDGEYVDELYMAKLL